MGISLEVYRARIGLHGPGPKKAVPWRAPMLLLHGTVARTCVIITLIITMVLMCSGDVETNPGPPPGKTKTRKEPRRQARLDRSENLDQSVVSRRDIQGTSSAEAVPDTDILDSKVATPQKRSKRDTYVEKQTDIMDSKVATPQKMCKRDTYVEKQTDILDSKVATPQKMSKRDAYVEKQTGQRHKNFIERNRVWLVQTIDVNGTQILDQLVQDGVISQNQMFSLKQTNSTNDQRVSALLDHLWRRTDEDWQGFIKCLEKHGHGHIVHIITKDFRRPDVYLLSPNGNDQELGITAILHHMKRTLTSVDKNIKAKILTPKEMTDMKNDSKIKVVGVIPETTRAAFDATDDPQKQVCGVVSTVESSRGEVSKYLNESALICFLSRDMFELWKHHLDPESDYKIMIYIPSSIRTDEKYLVTPKLVSPIRIVVDMQTISLIPECFDDILRVLEDLIAVRKTELKLCMLIDHQMSQFKADLELKAHKIKGKCYECKERSDINVMKENSVWLFPGGDKYISWTSLRPAIHGIPQIFTRDSQVYQIHQQAEPAGLTEGMIWEKTLDHESSVNRLKKCLSSILDDQEKAFDKALRFTRWFVINEYVISSASMFLQYALDKNLATIRMRVGQTLNKKTSVMVNNLRRSQHLMDDSPIADLLRRAWSNHMEDTKLIDAYNGCVVLRIYVADMASMTKLQSCFRKGNLGEFVFEMMLILWRSLFPDESMVNEMLELELRPPSVLQPVFQVETRNAAMNTLEEDGRDIWCRAAAAGAYDAMLYLLHQFPPARTVDEPGYVPLMDACRAGHMAIVKLLLDTYPILVQSVDQALVQAQREGKYQITKFLESKMENRKSLARMKSAHFSTGKRTTPNVESHTMGEEPAEEELVVRRPAVPKFGLPGIGGPNILQEMKAKRTTVRAVNKPDESEKVEGDKQLFVKIILLWTEDLSKKECKSASPVSGKGSLRPVEDGGSKDRGYRYFAPRCFCSCHSALKLLSPHTRYVHTPGTPTEIF